MFRFISLFILALIVSAPFVCLAGAQVHEQMTAKERSVNGKGDIIQDQETMEHDSKHFYLRLSEEDRRSFLNKIESIKIGANRKSVVALLGKPWSDQPIVTKKTGKFIYRAVKYYLAKKDKDLVNEHWDEWVVLDFNSNDQLVRVNTRIAGVSGTRP